MNTKPVISVFLTKFIFFLTIVISFQNFTWAKKTEKVIQIGVKSLLNGRAVTIVKNSRLLSWDTGVDRDNGYLTATAAIVNNGSSVNALPDNSLIKENIRHPQILLHYSNKNAKENQVLCIADTGRFSLLVPEKHYKSLFLSMTSAYGSTALKIEMVYKDGRESKTVTLPDWYSDIPANDPGLCYVLHNLGKWDQKNCLTEKDHHNIDAIILHPDVKRVLTTIKVEKGKAGYLLFWAATGVVK